MHHMLAQLLYYKEHVMILPISTVFLLLCVVFQMVFFFTIMRFRRKNKIALGDQNNITLKQRMRAQANFLEWAPLFILLVAFYEMQPNYIWSYPLLLISGVMFFIGRFLHAYSLITKEQYDEAEILISSANYRVRGMQLTLFSVIFLSTGLLLGLILSLS
jgi:uncharacterized membrane protein YecN with MAPEG domain